MNAIKTAGAQGLRRTKVILADELEWQNQGACRGEDPRKFFPKPPNVEQKAEIAKAICAVCPVKDICATWALREGETYGVWGGLSESEREAILEGRSRPRKRRYHSRVAAAWWGIDDDC